MMMIRSARIAAVILPFAIAAAPRAVDPPGAMPFDVAFGSRTIVSQTTLAPSPDGRWLAYDAVTPPDSNVSTARYQRNGTPTYVVGSRVYVVELSTNRTSEVCPGGTCWRPVWSPDGKLLAFYSDSGGAPQLWVYDPATHQSRRLTDTVIKPKLWTGDGVRWAPDGQTIYAPFAPTGTYHDPWRQPSLAQRLGPAAVTVFRSGSETTSTMSQRSDDSSGSPANERYKTENLVTVGAVNVRTGAMRPLVAAEASPGPAVFRLSASGKWLSYLSVWRERSANGQARVTDLAVVRTNGGAPITIARGLASPERDYFGTTYCWDPASDRLVYLQDQKLWLVDLSSGAPTRPTAAAPDLGALAPGIHWFTHDGKSLVVGIDPVDEKDYGDPRPRSIAIVPLTGGSPARFEIDDARWTFRSIMKDDERTVWQPDGSSITLVLTERATGDRALMRYDTRTGQSRILWQSLANLNNLTGDGRQGMLYGTYEDLHTPQNVYRFSADLASRTRLSRLEPRLDSVAVGATEVFETTIPLYDGRLSKARTAVLLPAGAKRGDKLPGIVTMYPGSDVSRKAAEFGGGSAFTVPNLIFTSRGYAVIMVDLELGPNREAGNPAQEMIDAILPQVYRAAELGYVDVNRVAIVGHSYGGYATASIITRTNLFRAAVPISGIYDLAGSYGRMEPDGSSGWIGWLEAGQARMGTHPWADERRYLDNSPYYQADKIHTPVLIIHGTADPAYEEGEKLFVALRRLGRPAELASYEGEGHVVSAWRRASAVDAASRMVEFLRQHLGDPSARSNSTK